MATVITTVGSRANDNVNISSVSGAGPWTVTLSAPPAASTVIGDTLSDEAAAPNTYLITGISGSDLTVRDAFAAGTSPSDAASSQAFTNRTYADILAFDADLDDTSLYAASDEAEVNVCEKITVTAVQTISNGSTVGLAKIIVQGHSAYRHDGSVGTTSIVEFTGSGDLYAVINITTTVPTEIRWLVPAALPASGTYNDTCGILISSSAAIGVHHCMIYSNEYAHDSNHGAYPWILGGISANESQVVNLTVSNNVIWKFRSTSSHGGGIRITYGGNLYAYNNTVYDCEEYGILYFGGSEGYAQNNVAMGCTGDFYTGWHASSSNNYSSDGSAPGTSSQTSQVVADTFVDYATNDFHIKATANARGAGANLEGGSYDIETDIDGDTRPASPTAWDIGADSYVTPPAPGIPALAIPTLFTS